MSGRRLIGLACAFSLATASTALAQDNLASPKPLPTTQLQVEDQLKAFDPAAVAAARHYYESPKVRDGMLSVLKSLTPAIIANEEKQKGATLSDADRAKLVTALDKAMSTNFDFLLGLNMIAALELLSKEQLVALDAFYSAPVGQSILGKMPQLGRRLPGIMQAFMPKFIGSLQTELKASDFGKP